MNRWLRLGIVTPSRGLIHSRTVEAVQRSLEYIAPPLWRWFFSHDRPIPDCFNVPMEQAWNWRADLFWIVEEDIAFPPPMFATLLESIREGADVAVSDYLMEDLAHDNQLELGVCKDGAGNVTWCRTGCILFKRECLESLPRPWFTLRNRLVKPGIVTWDDGEDRGYGADIPFTFALYQLGFKFAVVDITCDHLRVIERGNGRGSNDGAHLIAPLGGTEWQESMERMGR